MQVGLINESEFLEAAEELFADPERIELRENLVGAKRPFSFVISLQLHSTLIWMKQWTAF